MAGFGGDVEVMARLGGLDPDTVGTLQQMVTRPATTQGALLLRAPDTVWLLPNTPQYIDSIASPVEPRVAETPRAVRGWLAALRHADPLVPRSEGHTSERHSLMRIS